MVKQRLNVTINDKHKTKNLLKEMAPLPLHVDLFKLIRNTIIMFTINKNNWPDATTGIHRPRNATCTNETTPAHVTSSTL